MIVSNFEEPLLPYISTKTNDGSISAALLKSAKPESDPDFIYNESVNFKNGYLAKLHSKFFITGDSNGSVKVTRIQDGKVTSYFGLYEQIFSDQHLAFECKGSYFEGNVSIKNFELDGFCDILFDNGVRYKGNYYESVSSGIAFIDFNDVY